MTEKKHKVKAASRHRGKLSVRFLNISIIVFAVAFCVMAALTTVLFSGVTEKLTTEYAERYARSSAEALSAHISKELGLISKAARSEAVKHWLADEYNEQKKTRAFEELSGIVGELYSYNMYIGSDVSLSEYKIENDPSFDTFLLSAELNKNNPDDGWYFDCVSAESDYIISVGIDHFMQRKRVWLDYKVKEDGIPLGVICSGLEFGHIAGELFSKYDSVNMRGLIIDSGGLVHMDSSLMEDKDFL
ncbi:MAG: hypothetical protein FWG32_05415, partial [Oscillospiraceae bacterium]|nr:hypothetical protein [Oscillospiraceae bacterium]